jgi:hypothetical protein
MRQLESLLWSPTSTPVAHSSTPLGRNPEQEHLAEAAGSCRRVGVVRLARPP